jgi:HEPN domain-containing protein
MVNDPICFHCQQSAEKYLKALIQELGIPVPRTHRLNDLLVMLRSHHPTLISLGRVLNSLSRYAVDFRYPGWNAKRRQVRTALQHAERVRLAARRLLKLRP